MKRKWLKYLRPPLKMTISEWADKYRKLPSTSAEPGSWKTSRVPYMREVMDALNSPSISRVAVKSAAQVGKALWVETPIATADGFKAMGAVEVGDKVFDENGELCNVTAVSPIMFGRACYEIIFSDGARLTADAEHNWFVQENKRRGLKEYIKTTEEISCGFKNGKRNRYAIPVAQSLKLPEKILPIEPYTLGAWLGDGNSHSGQTQNPRIANIQIDPLEIDENLRTLGVLKNKHIPPGYLLGNREQRLELLRGLMDTDGTCSKNGRCGIVQKNKRLATDIMKLLWSLGLKPTMKVRLATFTYKGEKKSSLVYQITFLAYDDAAVFHLARKRARQKARAGCRTTETFRRRIIAVEKVASVPVKCISVDSPSHLYLAGEELIPTHNSEILLNIVGYYAHMSPCNVMIMQATLETAEDFSKSRLAKMIQDTPILTPLFYDKEKTRDPNQTILSKFFKGGRVILTGANSPAGLASRPIKILLCDETDRYPLSASKEGDPISLAEKRTTTYFDKKIALFSTPTLEGTSRIDVEYNLGTQEEWSHECPNCGEYHALRYENMIRGAVVKWRCPDCGHEFTRAQMTDSAQKYIVKNPGAIKNGIRSFWISGFSSPWLKWEEILREWDEAQGLPEREAVVMNTRFGLSYRFERREIDESALADNLIDYDGEIPSGVLCLTCGVDVQANRLHYAIYGFNAAQIYGISYGIIYGKPTGDEAWQGLDAILNKEYEFSDGRRLKIARTFIDSGFATDSVYKYCRRADAYAIKGLGTPGTPLLHKISTQGGVNLIILGVNEGKQSVLNRLEKIKYGRDDRFMIRNFDERFFKEMTAERKVLKKTGAGFVEVYENIFRQRNEALDCSVYAYAAMRSLITGDEKNFWLNQEENLRGESVKPAKKIIRHKTLDIWG